MTAIPAEARDAAAEAVDEHRVLQRRAAGFAGGFVCACDGDTRDGYGYFDHVADAVLAAAAPHIAAHARTQALTEAEVAIASALVRVRCLAAAVPDSTVDE